MPSSTPRVILTFPFPFVQRMRREHLIASGEALPAAMMDLDGVHVPLQRQEWQHPDDLFLQLWDPEEERYFYFNVATGDSTWYDPARYGCCGAEQPFRLLPGAHPSTFLSSRCSYVPYVDPEDVKEEELVKNIALAAMAATSSKSKPQRALGQLKYNEDSEDEEE